MSSSEERTARSFVERQGLWSDEQFEAAANADKWIEEHGLDLPEMGTLAYPDQADLSSAVVISESVRPAA